MPPGLLLLMLVAVCVIGYCLQDGCRVEVEALTWEVGGQRGCVTLIDVPRLRIYDDNDI